MPPVGLSLLPFDHVIPPLSQVVSIGIEPLNGSPPIAMADRGVAKRFNVT
jgi:hypothetical protein